MRIDYISLLVTATIVTNANSARLRSFPIDTNEPISGETQDLTNQENNAWHNDDERMLPITSADKYASAPLLPFLNKAGHEEGSVMTRISQGLKTLVKWMAQLLEPNIKGELANVNTLAQSLNEVAGKSHPQYIYVKGLVNDLVQKEGATKVAQALLDDNQYTTVGAKEVWKMLMKDAELPVENIEHMLRKKGYLDLADLDLLIALMEAKGDKRNEILKLVKSDAYKKAKKDAEVDHENFIKVISHRSLPHMQ
ncbi:hypothetical protein CCR75_002366 [Bremia lactucae]|uniref:Uncharacterized protein n=1 Tax=Bremia lactucae TaxID=4779 RepID=A0A976FN08_BRELC|nr:hypothetical protein CCR75_002366 [Bremia lactucae]